MVLIYTSILYAFIIYSHQSLLSPFWVLVNLSYIYTYKGFNAENFSMLLGMTWKKKHMRKDWMIVRKS